VKIFKTKDSIKEWRKHIPTIIKIGMVPTMGNLHMGHISLIKKSVEENQITVVTIFVNPTQFGPNEDFKNYPRTLEADLGLIKTQVPTQKEIIVFCPDSIQEIYPENFDSLITVGKLTKPLCGLSRPIHFNGVTTVVFKLFNMVHPHRAYFGLKDYQQFKVIEKMQHDLDLGVEVIGMPIIREESGLAMSSRNGYLSAEEKIEALALSKGLN
jgi:pantoate--beta-alanine ligase